MAAATDTAEREHYAPYVVVSTLDVVFAVVYALVAGAVLYLGVLTGPTRVLVAAPLVGFLPGYAVVSTLFPARPVREQSSAPAQPGGSAGWLERLSLSVGASLVVLAVLAVLVSLVGVPFSTGALTAAVVAVTIVGSIGGLWRRYRLPPDARVVVPVAKLVDDLRGGTVDAHPVDAALNVAVLVAVVVAASTVAVGFAAPDGGESYSEVAILSDDDELVAGNYTESVQRGESTSFTLSVGNERGTGTDYTAVVVLERLDDANGDTVVVEREELDRVTLTVADGEATRQRVAVEPTMLGTDLRLNVYVYEGDAPETASAATAPHHLYLWLDVERANASSERVQGGALAVPTAGA